MEVKSNTYKLNQKNKEYILTISQTENGIKYSCNNSLNVNIIFSKGFTIDEFKKLNIIFDTIKTPIEALNFMDNSLKSQKVGVKEKTGSMKLIFFFNIEGKVHQIEIPLIKNEKSSPDYNLNNQKEEKLLSDKNDKSENNYNINNKINIDQKPIKEEKKSIKKRFPINAKVSGKNIFKNQKNMNKPQINPVNANSINNINKLNKRKEVNLAKELVEGYNNNFNEVKYIESQNTYVNNEFNKNISQSQIPSISGNYIENGNYVFNNYTTEIKNINPQTNNKISDKMSKSTNFGFSNITPFSETSRVLDIENQFNIFEIRPSFNISKYIKNDPTIPTKFATVIPIENSDCQDNISDIPIHFSTLTQDLTSQYSTITSDPANQYISDIQDYNSQNSRDFQNINNQSSPDYQKISNQYLGGTTKNESQFTFGENNINNRYSSSYQNNSSDLNNIDNSISFNYEVTKPSSLYSNYKYLPSQQYNEKYLTISNINPYIQNNKNEDISFILSKRYQKRKSYPSKNIYEINTYNIFNSSKKEVPKTPLVIKKTNSAIFSLSMPSAKTKKKKKSNSIQKKIKNKNRITKRKIPKKTRATLNTIDIMKNGKSNNEFEGIKKNLKIENQLINQKIDTLVNTINDYKNKLLENSKVEDELNKLKDENKLIKQQLLELQNLKKNSPEMFITNNNKNINININTKPLQKRSYDFKSLKSISEVNDFKKKLSEIESIKGQIVQNNILNVDNSNNSPLNILRKELDEIHIYKQQLDGLNNYNNNLRNIENIKNKIKELENIKKQYDLETKKINQLENEIEEFKNTNYNEFQNLQEIKKDKSNFRNNQSYIDDNVKGEIIRNSDELILLTNKINFNKTNKKIILNLLYKASADSDKAYVFHSKCDFAEKTLVLIETDKGKRFGGYTTCSWSGNGIKKDDNAFIFSLDKMEIYQIFLGQDAIGCYPNYGPIFLGNQIIIYDNAFSFPGKTFKKGFNYNTQEDFELTGGVMNFNIKDIEVYEVITE